LDRKTRGGASSGDGKLALSEWMPGRGLKNNFLPGLALLLRRAIPLHKPKQLRQHKTYENKTHPFHQHPRDALHSGHGLGPDH
jgi:hypothetical protein